MEHARLDRVQHLGHQPEEPKARGAIALRPVAAELGLLRLGQHVEPEAQVRAKPAHVADQSELEFTRPSTPTKPARIPMDTDRAARLAIARRAQRTGTGDQVRLTLTIFLTRRKAERLSARAIREQKNLEAVVAEILEAAE
jgi:hypothetical protein